MTTVFISYSRKDIAPVRRMHAALAAREHQTWVDWEGIPPTAEWMREIRGAVDAAQAFAFVLSPDSLASRVCREELEHAVAQGKRLIPVVCRDVVASEVPEPLARLNWVYCREQDDFEAAMNLLVQAVDTDLQHVQTHTQLLLRAVDWEGRGQDSSLTLRGAALSAAERWLAEGAAQTPRPTALQTRYILQSRRTADRRRLSLLGAAGAALVVVAVLGVATFIERRNAARQQTLAIAGRLAADADLVREQSALGMPGQTLERSLLLAAESARQLDAVGATALQTDRALRRALALQPPAWPVRQGFVEPVGERALALQADGSVQLASGSLKLERWNAAGELEHPALEVAVPRTAALAFTPDGRFLVTRPGDTERGRIDVRDARTLALRATVLHPAGDADAVAVDAQARVLVAAYGRYDAASNQSTPDRTHVVDLADPGQPVVAQLPHASDLALSPDGRWLALLVAGQVRLWALERQPTLRLQPVPLEPTQREAWQILFSADGSHLVANLAVGGLEMWPVGETRSVLVGEPPFSALAVGPQARVAVGRAGTNRLQVRDLVRDRELAQLEYRDHDVLAFSPDGLTLAITGTNDDGPVVRLWRLDQGGSDLLDAAAVLQRKTLAFSADASQLQVVSGDVLRSWALAQASAGTAPTSRPLPLQDPMTAHSTDGRVLAVLSGQRVLLMDAATGATLHERRFEGRPSALAIGPDGQALAVALQGGGVWWWGDAQQAEPARLATSGEVPQGFLAVGERKASLSLLAGVPGAASRAGQNWRVLRWHPPASEPVADFALDKDRSGLFASPCGFSPDAQRVASPHHSGGIAVRDTARGQVLLQVDHTGGAPACAFSHDNRQLAVGTGSTVRLWNLETGTETGRLEGLETLNALVFSPDNRYLATTEGDGRTRVWLLHLADLVARACERIALNLGPAAWSGYLGERPYRPTCPAAAEPPAEASGR
jgi:WD40 repeat protein